MADYLPDMVAPPPEPLENLPVPQNDHIPDNIEEDVRENDEGEMIDEEPIEVEEQQSVAAVITREKLDMDTVFRTPKVKPVKRSREEMAEEKRRIREAVKLKKQEDKELAKQEKILQKEREKAERKANKPKKQISPEHLAKLQAARQKSADERRQKKALEKEARGQPMVKQEQLFTKEDLIKSQYEAIQLYDSKRKKEKQEKRAKQEEDRKLAESQKTIRRAIGQPDPNDIWSHALNGMFQ